MPFQGFPSTSVAANAITANILAGKTFEFIARGAARLAIVASATGLNVQIINGTEVVALAEAVPVKSGLNLTTPDDYHFRWAARGRQQIIVTNTTGGALSFTAMLEVQPI